MKEQISALMDDEIDVEAADHLFKGLEADGTLTECWTTYHMIGDALRGEQPLRADFHQRLMRQLDAEPTVLAPVHRKVHKPAFLMSVAASVAAVMFVGWMALQQTRSPTQELATATVAQNAVSPESVNSYLVAHQSNSAGSGMQAAYYIQPVALSGNGN